MFFQAQLLIHATTPDALYLSPVSAEAGELLYFFASQLDVTRRREAEALAQQGQRMDALGSMAAGVAHEFGNMMTIVRGVVAWISS